MSSTREVILEFALAAFEAKGYEATTTASICRASGVSNGSFFHHFGSKDGVAAALFLQALHSYHNALARELPQCGSAEAGIAHLVTSHLTWVVENKPQARFVFEQSRAEWMTSIESERAQENQAFAQALEAWRQPLIESGQLPEMPPLLFFSQVIGPAQLLSRQWLSSPTGEDIRRHTRLLSDCAVRAMQA